MSNLAIARQAQMIQSLIGRTRNASAGDLEMQAHWAKYLCVLAAGYLENALREVFTDFCNRSSSPQVAGYAASNLRRIRNPKAALFVDITSTFDKAWGSAVEAFLDDDGRRQAIDSIIANRHLIAHGKSSDITVARVDQYFRKVVDVVDFIETVCGR